MEEDNEGEFEDPKASGVGSREGVQFTKTTYNIEEKNRLGVRARKETGGEDEQGFYMFKLPVR